MRFSETDWAMSRNLTNVARIEFDAQVKAAYGAAGKLRRMVRYKGNVVGNEVRFRRTGRGMATRRIPQTDLTPLNLTYTTITCTLADWIAAEYTDVFDQQKTDVQERGIVAAEIGHAIGRREDQMIIDALDAANAANAIPVGTTGMTDAKLRRAQALMDQRSVPEGMRKLIISARAKEDLLADVRFSSRDYVEATVIRTGRLPQIYGFDCEVIETRDEGGLPLAGTTRTNFAFDMQAIGLAVGLSGTTAVDWIAEKTSWLASQPFSGGAVAIDSEGIIEIETLEAA
jgi:hypothetical protein